MHGMTVTMDQAREAKAKAVAMSRTAEWPAVGVGIGQSDGQLAVKVNLSQKTRKKLPVTIDGVPVIYEIVGVLEKRGVAVNA